MDLYAAKTVIDRVVVKVNDDIILESDITRFKQRAQAKSYQELIGIDPASLKDRKTLIELLIEEKIIDQQVKKLELAASDAETEAQIRAIMRRTGISQAQLTERLKQLGTNMSDYREGIKRQIERKNLIEREIKPSIETSEEQLRHFYNRTVKESSDVQYKIAHILIEKGAAHITPQERARVIFNEAIQDPARFPQLVEQYSDDESSKSVGGVLGYFNSSLLSKEFRAVVPKTPVGQVVGPIKTANGFHIVKVLEVRAPDFSTLSKDQKEALRMQMTSSELESKMRMWIERKRSEAHIQVFESALQGAK